MPADPHRPWTLLGFTDRFAAWVDLETIDDRLGQVVSDWIETRRTNPTDGARRELSVPNLWWAQVPNTLHKGGEFVVICSFWVREGSHEVECDNFGSVSWPV